MTLTKKEKAKREKWQKTKKKMYTGKKWQVATPVDQKDKEKNEWWRNTVKTLKSRFIPHFLWKEYRTLNSEEEKQKLLINKMVVKIDDNEANRPGPEDTIKH